MNRWLKRGLIVLAIVLVIVLVAGFFIGNFFYNLALNPNADRGDVLNAEHNQMDFDEQAIEKSKQDQQWFEDESGYHNIHMQSYDDLKLHAFVVQTQTPSDRWVIAVHGYSGTAQQHAGAARHFNELGFNVLMPDCRGHGDSEGNYIGMGWDDRLDMVAWIHLLIEDYGKNIQIVLYGVSMGGATVMMTSGEELPDNVKAIVEDCGYTSAWDEFAYQLKELFGLPTFPVLNFADTMTRIRAGYGLKEASALSQVRKSQTPIFFIHGSEDTFVPSSMLDQLYAAATVEKEYWLVEGAGHGGAASTAGDLYWRRVEAFIEKYVF